MSVMACVVGRSAISRTLDAFNVYQVTRICWAWTGSLTSSNIMMSIMWITITVTIMITGAVTMTVTSTRWRLEDATECNGDVVMMSVPSKECRL